MNICLYYLKSVNFFHLVIARHRICIALAIMWISWIEHYRLSRNNYNAPLIINSFSLCFIDRALLAVVCCRAQTRICIRTGQIDSDVVLWTCRREVLSPDDVSLRPFRNKMYRSVINAYICAVNICESFLMTLRFRHFKCQSQFYCVYECRRGVNLISSTSFFSWKMCLWSLSLYDSNVFSVTFNTWFNLHLIIKTALILIPVKLYRM